MYKYRRLKLKEEDKFYPQSNEEITKSDNYQTISNEISNKNYSSSYKRYLYKRFTKNNISEEEIETENNNNENNDENDNENDDENDNESDKKQNNKNNNNYKNDKQNSDYNDNNNNIESINEDDENINGNSSIKLSSKKDLILKKLEDIEPIIEDKEGEENISPYKQDSINDDINSNDFQNENDENKSPNIDKNKPAKTERGQKYYDNELIDTILNVEKYNVNKYLSKDLAEMYSAINKDNLFFKNDIFLRNIDNFERKTGNLDKKKFYSSYFIDDINYKMKEVPKTDEIISKFVEKSKFFN